MNHLGMASAAVGALLLIAACSGGDDNVQSAATGLSSNTTVTFEHPPSGVSDAKEGSVTPMGPEDVAGFEPSAFESDATFWAQLANPMAFEVEHYSTVQQMTDLASVVIIGRVRATGPTRAIGEPGVEGDEVTYWGMEVEVIKVLRGDLEPNSGDEVVTVEALGAVAGDLPRGAAVFFLRHKLDPPPGGRLTGPTPEGEEDKYRLVSSQGLFIDSPDGARNPISDALHGVIGQTGGVPVFDPQRHDDEPLDPVAEQVRGMSMADLLNAILGS